MTAARRWHQFALAGSLLLPGLPRVSWADALTFTGSDLSGRSASVTFDVSLSTLTVTLSNTSLADTLVPSDLLTAVFFSLPEGVALSPVSATLAAGSTLVSFPVTDPPTTDLSGEWAYATVGFPTSQGQMVGISSAGFGLFGPPDRFDTASNLDGPESPNGMNFGIASAGDNLVTGNRPVRTVPHIQNAVVFELDIQGGLAVDQITNVIFQYGTDSSEPSFPGGTVPEPEPPPGS